MQKSTLPGVSRTDRLSEEGLQRLRKQLSVGAKISQPVLAQWVKRYGAAAQAILDEHGIVLKK